MSKYLHTLNGRPAAFDGYQICFANYYGKPNILANSLSQIRREQRITVRNRRRGGFDVDLGDYDHFRYD